MARLFDGTDDYLTATLDLSSTAIVTVSLRLWWNAFDASGDRIIEYSSNPDAGFSAFSVAPNDASTIGMAMSGFAGSTYWSDSFPVPSAAAWHLYTFVFDRTNDANKAWVDGVSQTLTPLTHNANATLGNYDATSTQINVMRRGTGAFFGAGRMAELAIWAVELSAANLASLHGGAKPNGIDSGNLLYYLPICGTASPEPAIIGNTATVNGAVATSHPVANFLCADAGLVRLYGPAQLSTSAADLYTVPTGRRTRLRHIYVNNPSGAEVEFTASVGTDAAATRLYDLLEIPAGESLEWAYDHALVAGEKVQAYHAPFSAAVLDTFTRANEDPTNSNWDGPLITGDAQLAVISNTLGKGAGASFGGEWWSAAEFGPDIEAYVTLAAVGGPGDEFSLFARMQSLDGSPNGYLVRGSKADAAADIVSLRRFDNGSSTVLGVNILQELSVGDKLGIRVIGSTIEAWYQASGGTWTLLGSRTDTTYSGVGRLGIEIESSAWRLDDFGGGTIAPPVITIDGYVESA